MKPEFISYDAIVVGTGAAGYNAAYRIKQSNTKTVAIVTEGVNTGTSRNTGSDKQTYYKLGLSGDTLDSVRNMAQNLFDGGCVDGDNALCEAALSVRCFMNLCEAGVPFPVNRYGEYIGYKTDHDPFERATSAGPLTSKFMTECLQKQTERLNIPVYDHLLAVEILKDEHGVCGLLCIDNVSGEFKIFRTPNIILATGGPAGIYADSVYPECHTGSSSLALNAGTSIQNMTEWQYGLASVSPRWNVSGTYMQALPRFVSVDENGNENEFLSEYFSDPYKALSAVFLKGYQWPFDCKKVLTGSSVIDLLVYRESVIKKRRVYLDFHKNPFNLTQIDYKRLSEEAYNYLSNAEACFGTPIERLRHMNSPAIDLYKSKGLDISVCYLEIALCAQHNNGGISVDKWWKTSIDGLFAVGECAGTHGVTRPGGSALNAGQVGSLRAAQFICASNRVLTEEKEFIKIATKSLNCNISFCNDLLSHKNNIQESLIYAMRKMSDCGGAIRNPNSVQVALTETENKLRSFPLLFGVDKKASLFLAYKLKDILTMQYAVLSAISDYIEVIGKTRGSALYYNPQGILRDGLEEIFRFTQCEDKETFDKIQEIKLQNEKCIALWRNVRPIPLDKDVFETVWRQYRENKNIY